LVDDLVEIRRNASKAMKQHSYVAAYEKLNVAVTNCALDLSNEERSDLYLDLAEVAAAMRSRRLCRENIKAAGKVTGDRADRAVRIKKICHVN